MYILKFVCVSSCDQRMILELPITHCASYVTLALCICEVIGYCMHTSAHSMASGWIWAFDSHLNNYYFTAHVRDVRSHRQKMLKITKNTEKQCKI